MLHAIAGDQVICSQDIVLIHRRQICLQRCTILCTQRAQFGVQCFLVGNILHIPPEDAFCASVQITLGCCIDNFLGNIASLAAVASVLIGHIMDSAAQLCLVHNGVVALNVNIVLHARSTHKHDIHISIFIPSGNIKTNLQCFLNRGRDSDSQLDILTSFNALSIHQLTDASNELRHNRSTAFHIIVREIIGVAHEIKGQSVNFLVVRQQFLQRIIKILSNLRMQIIQGSFKGDSFLDSPIFRMIQEERCMRRIIQLVRIMAIIHSQVEENGNILIYACVNDVLDRITTGIYIANAVIVPTQIVFGVHFRIIVVKGAFHLRYPCIHLIQRRCVANHIAVTRRYGCKNFSVGFLVVRPAHTKESQSFEISNCVIHSFFSRSCRFCVCAVTVLYDNLTGSILGDRIGSGEHTVLSIHAHSNLKSTIRDGFCGLILNAFRKNIKILRPTARIENDTGIGNCPAGRCNNACICRCCSICNNRR